MSVGGTGSPSHEVVLSGLVEFVCGQHHVGELEQFLGSAVELDGSVVGRDDMLEFLELQLGVADAGRDCDFDFEVGAGDSDFVS